MFFQLIQILFFLSLLIPFNSFSSQSYCPPYCDSRVRTKFDKKFDFDRNGFISPYERALMTTHHLFGWKPVTKDKMKLYDHNKDNLLDPIEWAQYENRKKTKLNPVQERQKRDEQIREILIQDIKRQ